MEAAGSHLRVQYVGYYLAHTLLICLFVLYFGRDICTRSPLTGSVLSTALRLHRLAKKGRCTATPVKFIQNMKVDSF